MIYLDNSATTLVKPSRVLKEMSSCLESYSANPGRGGHRLSLYAGEKVFECRENLAKLFNAQNPQNIIFTKNATEGLNLAIKGLLNSGDHVVITSMEHNSVLRPLKKLEKNGISFSVLEADKKGIIDSQKLENLILENTRLVIVNHSSNVCGTVSPIDELIKITHKYNAIFMMDSSQSAGILPIDVTRQGIDILAFTGHKALFGPQGTGGLYLKEGLVLDTLEEGGTGSQSENVFQPDELPDRFESGTLNTVGIVGLCEGVKFILKNTVDEIKRYEDYLTTKFLEKLSDIKGITIYGTNEIEKRIGVIGINFNHIDSIEASNILDKHYNIATRGGLHCSFLAHKTLGTLKGGILRFSLSYVNKVDEINKAVNAVYKISKKI